MIVTVPELKAHLRVVESAEDAYLETLLAQSQAAAEDFCRVTFIAPAPEPVCFAVILMASHYFENRDNSDKQAYITMRMTFESLLFPYHDMTKMF